MATQIPVRQLTKEQFAKFKKVRTRTTPLLGQHSLYVRNSNKYIYKQLPATIKYFTTKTNTNTIFTYFSSKNTKILLLPLQGTALSLMSFKKKPDTHLQSFLEKQGNFENALGQIFRQGVKSIEEKKIKDMILECFRVYNGLVQYCHDSWMADSRKIVRQSIEELQNYYFSQEDLILIQSTQDFKAPTRISLFFRLAILVLNLGTSHLNLRNYQFNSYELKWENIWERLNNFKLQFSNSKLYYFLERILKGEKLTFQEVQDIINKEKLKGVNIEGILKPSNRHRNNSDFSIITSNCDESSIMKNQASFFTNCGSVVPKKKLTLKSQKENKSIKTFQIEETDHFNIKKRLTENKIQSKIDLLIYLGLEEYLPQVSYQHHILNCLENIYIKTNWNRILYPNGSLYFGQLQQDKRQGFGLYLFESNDFYIGEWCDNVINGKGTYVFKTGQAYNGDLKMGTKHGHGIYYYTDGRIYEGSWLDNCKSGFGTIKFPNSVNFIGHFGSKQGKNEGLFYDEITGEKWNGILQQYEYKLQKFKNNEQKLQRAQQYRIRQEMSLDSNLDIGSKESIYKGQLDEFGRKCGFGIQQQNEQKYEGQWKNDKYQGSGKLIIKGKYEINGLWSHGMLIKYI